MVSRGSELPPTLSTWADVEPARYPFDSRELVAELRTVLASLPALERREGEPLRESEAWDWVSAASEALADRYGAWAYRWHWGPDQFERGGWIVDRIPPKVDVPVFVAERLVLWRRWLESLAEWIDPLRPELDPERWGESPGVFEAWQFAIARLLRTVDARTVDGDDWQGWCRRTLQWLLTANDVPAQQAETLVSRAIGERFASWTYLTEIDIASVSEQLARDVLATRGIDGIPSNDFWPDTWPQDWPSWRATNTGARTVRVER